MFKSFANKNKFSRVVDVSVISAVDFFGVEDLIIN
jgi:hypothetical protein